jgi:type II secretory pathway predicted ATPase ExeA
MNELDQLARSWGASAVPFSQLTEAQWINTPQHERALQLLNQTAALRGLMLLSGANGLGKSVLAARWLRSLEPRLYHAVTLTQATLTGSSVLAALVSRLGKRVGFRRERHLDEIAAFLAEHERQTLIVVLDEAQNYAHEALEELRLLLGLNLPTQPTFALVLLGDEYLLGQLQLRNHRALYSRLSAHYTLGPWTASHIEQYLQKGLEAVGIHRSVFEPAAVDLLIRASAGVPRSVCLVARAAWLAAATTGAQTVNLDLLQSALEQVPGVPGFQPATVAA